MTSLDAEPATYLRTETLPLTRLTPFPGNAKRGDVPRILESLTRNGQYRSLVVRELPDGGGLVVLAGNHTLAALTAHGPGPCGMTVRTGQEERPCAVCHGQEWEPEVRCEIVRCDDATATRVNLVDNRASEAGSWDEEALAELLGSLDDVGGTGYTDTDLADLLEVPEDTAAEEPEEPEEEPAHERPEEKRLAAPAPAGEEGPREHPAPTQAPPPGHVQLVLTYSVEDRDEAARLISAARDVLPAAAASEVVLRALRTLVAVVDSRHSPDGAVTVEALLKAAGIAAS